MQFKARRSEILRAETMVRKLWPFDNLGLSADDVLDFIREHYREDVPYHGQLHPLWGLVYELHKEHTHSLSMKVGLEWFETVLAWMMHDAGHNGNAKESPEWKSAAIGLGWLKDKHPELMRLDRDLVPVIRKAVLATIYPYKEVASSSVVKRIRLLDTARNSAGLTADVLGVSHATAFHAYLYEGMPLILEFFGDAAADAGLHARWIKAQGTFLEQTHEYALKGFFGDDAELLGKISFNTLRNRNRIMKQTLEEFQFLHELCTNGMSFSEFVSACVSRRI